MSEYTDRTCGIGLPKDDKKTPVPKDKIDLTIGVFFDGTANNKYNSGSGKNNDEASYIGTWTNVASLWRSYYSQPKELIEKVYLEGSGTVTPVPKKDSALSWWDNRKNAQQWKDGQIIINDDKLTSSGDGDDHYQGTGFGFGSNGINAKIARACKLVALKLDQMRTQTVFKKHTVNSITIDVFGFSRGAAAARSFASRLKGKAGAENEKFDVILHKKLSSELKNAEISVRFMGLFDTVSSYHNGSNISPTDHFNTKNVEELALTIPQYVDMVVHLVAADEYRANFSVTNIKSARLLGFEIRLPGAHSDIGGGYVKTETEDVFMSSYYDTGERKCRGYMSLEQLQEGLWITPEWFEKKKYMLQDGSTRIMNNYKRYVKNDYSRIPLGIMRGYAQCQKSIKFKDDSMDDSTEIQDANLIKLKDRLDRVAFKGESLYDIQNNQIVLKNENDLRLIKRIRYDFIHLSARNETGHEATKDNVRTIIQG